MNGEVREVRRGVGVGVVPRTGHGDPLPRWERGKTAADRADSGEQFRRPGGTKRRGRRGERRRGAGAFIGGAREANPWP